MRPGVQASVRATWPFAAAAWVFVEGDAKTQGWVAGNVYLDAAVSARAGVEAIVF